MNGMIRLALTFVLMSTVLTAAATALIPMYVSAPYRVAISDWLRHHPGYRIAVDVDCSCEDAIARTRAGSPPNWPRIPDYHPYYMVGDFRGDGAKDVAVGVIAAKDPKKFRVLIIHGEPVSVHAAKYFLSEPWDLGEGLFYGPPRPKPWRLIVGAFESEGALFEPAGPGYIIAADDDD